jgi:hypothetical protein
MMLSILPDAGSAEPTTFSGRKSPRGGRTANEPTSRDVLPGPFAGITLNARASTRLGALLMVVVATLFTVSARADIEFIGILATSESTRFALADTATGRTDWVGRGDRFGGYTVTSFDAKNDTLLLQRDATVLKIRLKDDAKVKAARVELTGSITFSATESMEIERVTLLFDQENVFPLKDGVTYRITPERRPDGSILYRTSIERVLGPNKFERISSPGVVALPGQQFSMRIDDLSFSFKPR